MSSMFISPRKIPAMKGFEQKGYTGLKVASYKVKINPFVSTKVACQVQRIDPTMIMPVDAPEASRVPSIPAVDQRLVSRTCD